ncbi:tripartite tricarboxylate transporter TctB family protein [uncultured Oxalicibacterium sp.]|uniref:tripartite tricarboxylate transporter TctB family protein n=1 Tax=uncultured Oxalicibacterium sp. TaxID=1168540 RepID=UPI0025FA881C|nr:tripartite tricarboxylate transporter TctB family protein [uncultured Oxalicibacterium sp.]
MDQHSESNGGVRTGVAHYVVEAAVAGLLLLLGIVVAISSWELGAGWTSDGPGSGYFPFYIGLVICISGAGTLFQALFGKEKNTEIFVDSEQLKRIFQVLIPAAIYVGAIQLIGIYVASAIYIALFMIFLGKFAPWKAIVAALGVNTLFFMMFEVWFKVPLYKGAVNLLSFIGY